MALTRTQIENKIYSLSRDKNNCEGKKSSYKTSLTYANKLVGNLKDCLNNLNLSNDYLKRYFTINNKIVDGGKIENNKTEINKIIKQLNNIIIPNINKNINELTNKINSISKEINSLKRQLETTEM